MTLASEQQTAAEVAREFFDVYRRQDVNAMVELCSDNAEFSYVPFEMWRKQAVLRGDGKVRSIGKPIWAGLIHAFPDLTNEVRSVTADGDGNVAVEVVIGGTQSGPWGPIAPRGQAYSEPHLFVMHVDADSKIDSITGYWDNASIYRQLGHLEVD
ncbi:MAG: nuclear transport factor 2 family protein [Pseudonocardiaceae bacterium]